MTALEAAKEPIKLFLDGAEEPFKIALPPLRFRFSTLHLADGPHELRIEASNGLAPPTVRRVPFHVRNGVALSVSGLSARQTIGGQVELIVNAFAGNTEVDFEPLRAETPQPIPTWIWVLFLAVIAWALFYLFNPHIPRGGDDYVPPDPTSNRGEQIYVDSCARCHGEQGQGIGDAKDASFFRVPPLRNATAMAVAASPAPLLTKVIVGARQTQMPAWGPLLSNDALVDVVNHVRGAWGHDASPIRLRFRDPPRGVLDLESRLVAAIRAKDATALAAVGWPLGARPIVFRRGDDNGGTIGRREVTKRWADYFEAQCDGAVTALQLREVRYDFEPEAVEREGATVIAMGRVYQASRTHEGGTAAARGRFIRIYRRKRGRWHLALDFADLPFRVGCGPEPERTPPPKPPPPVDLGAPLGYAEVKGLLAGIGKDASGAPHANFWDLSYQAFVDFVFDYELVEGDARVRLVVPYHSDKSNLIRSLRDNATMLCALGGDIIEVDVRRMPVAAAPLSEKQIAQLAAWVDAGCPEVGGSPSGQARREPEELLRAR